MAVEMVRISPLALKNNKFIKLATENLVWTSSHTKLHFLPGSRVRDMGQYIFFKREAEDQALGYNIWMWGCRYREYYYSLESHAMLDDSVQKMSLPPCLKQSGFKQSSYHRNTDQASSRCIKAAPYASLVFLWNKHGKVGHGYQNTQSSNDTHTHQA